MTLSFTIPTPADADRIARLHVASWREAYAGIVPASVLESVDIDDRIARWQGYLSGGQGMAFLAEADGEAAGFIRAGRPDELLAEDADGHIFALYVLARHHRKGIGRRLLGLASEAWLKRGGRALSVGVLTDNRPAVAFYEAAGARFLRPEVYEWGGHGLAQSIYLFENLPELARLA